MSEQQQQQQEHKPIERALIIVAHPDDIEFGAGGTVAVWTDAGVHVTYCIVTNGASGSNDPAGWAGLIERREEEQRAAAAIVGVSDVRFLGYPDGTLQPTIALRRDLTRIIRELKPDAVMIMDPTTILLQQEDFSYINHPDHRAAGEASLYAVFPSAESRPIFPELLDEGYEPHHVRELWLTISTQPNTYIDVSAVHARKIESLLCHRSQLGEEVVAMIQQWDAVAGKKIDVQYAEEFRVMRFPVNETTAAPISGTANTD